MALILVVVGVILSIAMFVIMRVLMACRQLVVLIVVGWFVMLDGALIVMLWVNKAESAILRLVLLIMILTIHVIARMVIFMIIMLVLMDTA